VSETFAVSGTFQCLKRDPRGPADAWSQAAPSNAACINNPAAPPSACMLHLAACLAPPLHHDATRKAKALRCMMRLGGLWPTEPAGETLLAAKTLLAAQLRLEADGASRS
jgi:hypothetical protein